MTIEEFIREVEDKGPYPRRDTALFVARTNS